MALTDNLIALWELDETSGTRVDAHAAYDLTDNNTVGSATGVLSNAASFVAANSEYLSLADDPAFDVTSDFSVSVWIYDNAANYNHNPATILAKGAYDIGAAPMLLYISFGSIVFSWRAGFSEYGLGMTMPGASQAWRHIVGTFDSTAMLARIYIDGSLAGTSATLGAGPSANSEPFQIGAQSGGGGARYWDGRIDQPAIFSRRISDAEVSSIYNGGAGLAYTSWVGGGAPATSLPFFPPRIPAAILAR